MKLRLLLATAAAVAASAAPFVQPASAAVCNPALQEVCSTAGIPCRMLAANPKLPDCPPMG
ncbi:MAG TPA: hypothetical protein VGX28_17055 [Frankiaceae bacterium]|jgi:hypothetical protein|nr:hypothetical protein [Frankiaceae bacterium]